jgi:hypothetical protein
VKLLLGTHHLEMLGGSELFAAELAFSIRARGHEVAIFTFFKGELARSIEAQGIPVFDSDDVSGISLFTPDIVQTSHLPCAHFLRAVVPEAIRVHVMLGVIPNLEAPPLDAVAFSLGLVISEEVAERVNRAPFGRDVDVVIFRNWFDESAVAVAATRGFHQRMRVAVISNHIAPRLVDALDEIEIDGRVSVDFFGAQRTSVAINGALLVQYDLVISIGRTVLLAAACGVPCIMADIHGSDGLLTADNLDLVRTTNFSGRLTRSEITKRHLLEEIGKLRSYDREELRRRVTAEYALSGRTEWILSRYEALLARQMDDAKNRRALPAFSAPSEGLVYADLTATVRHLRRQLEAAQRQLEVMNQIPGWARPLGAGFGKTYAKCRSHLDRWRRQIAGRDGNHQ